MSETSPISAFPASTTFDDSDVLIGNDGAVTKRFTGNVVANGTSLSTRYQPIFEPMQDFGSSSGVTRTMDLAVSRLFRIVLAGTVTLAVTGLPPADTVATFALEVTSTGGTMVWPSSFKWAGGVAPTFPNGTVKLVSGYTRDNGATFRVSASEAFA